VWERRENGLFQLAGARLADGVTKAASVEWNTAGGMRFTAARDLDDVASDKPETGIRKHRSLPDL
jgi:hypothetical protein